MRGTSDNLFLPSLYLPFHLETFEFFKSYITIIECNLVNYPGPKEMFHFENGQIFLACPINELIKTNVFYNCSSPFFQNGQECWCGNNYKKYGPSRACRMRCHGNNRQICGGPWALSVYVVGKVLPFLSILLLTTYLRPLDWPRVTLKQKEEID